MIWDMFFRSIAVIAAIYLAVCLVYFLFQERFIFVPKMPGFSFSNKLASSFESLTFNTPYKGRIHAILIRVSRPKGLIFYLHGNTGNLNRWQLMAEEISGYGYDVFAMDYRHYGLSRGKRSEAIMHRDVEYCFDEIVERYKSAPIVIYGRSLGSGFATRLASRRSVSRVILETPFYNLLELASWYLPFLPIKLLLRYKFRSDLYIQRIHCPVLIAHGTRDSVVPYSSALKLYRHALEGNTHVQMVTLVGGKHSNLNTYALFREKLNEFLS